MYFEQLSYWLTNSPFIFDIFILQIVYQYNKCVMCNNEVIAFFNRQMENLVHGQLILLLWCTTLLPIKLVGKTNILQGLDCIFF